MKKILRDKKIKHDTLMGFGVAFVKAHNPLGIPYKSFQDIHVCYLWVMEQMKLKYPKGYVDFVLFLSDILEQPYFVICDLFAGQRKLITDSFFFDYSDLSREDLNVLRNVFQLMHQRMDTRFSEAHFLQAISLFNEHIKNGKNGNDC